jgi:cytochrome c551/c552
MVRREPQPRSDGDVGLSSARQLTIWIGVAVAASALLIGVLRRQHGDIRARWATPTVGNPQTGSELFRAKGCSRCHDVMELSRPGDDPAASGSRPDELVAAVWNHAPAMWERVRSEQVPYPAVDHQEMAHLLAYLFTVRSLSAPGDPSRGRTLVEAKGCRRCHGPPGGGEGPAPDLRALSVADSPFAWARAMWNHDFATEPGVDRPRFEGQEMHHVLAFVRGEGPVPNVDGELLAADPDRGWELFEAKSWSETKRGVRGLSWAPGDSCRRPSSGWPDRSGTTPRRCGGPWRRKAFEGPTS